MSPTFRGLGGITRRRQPRPEVRLFVIHDVTKCSKTGNLFLHVFVEKSGAKYWYAVPVHPNLYDDERHVWARLCSVSDSGLPRRLEFDHLSP